MLCRHCGEAFDGSKSEHFKKCFYSVKESIIQDTSVEEFINGFNDVVTVPAVLKSLFINKVVWECTDSDGSLKVVEVNTVGLGWNDKFNVIERQDGTFKKWVESSIKCLKESGVSDLSELKIPGFLTLCFKRNSVFGWEEDLETGDELTNLISINSIMEL